MGQCISTNDSKRSIMRQRPSSKRFYRSKNSNLSATFHVLDSDLRWDLLNINYATEEELMTLPGINRVVAENIIEYRQRIGGFRRVEDLAVVSGVGATKLEQFRTEICVGRRKPNLNSSLDSSLTQSTESLLTNDCSKPSPRMVNVNTANVFQLMSVCRMTQEMAATIVHYRDRKGPFKSLNDLSKVKGLPLDRLAVVKIYLTVDSSVTNSTTKSRISENSVRPIGHRRTNSAPNGFGKSKSCDPSTRDFYELVSSLVTRPPGNEIFDFSHSGRTVSRLASWNLEDFVLQKAKNPGVQEVICRTILENGFSIVAVQEVASREALSLIVSELNEPKLLPVQDWKGDRGKWRSVVPSSSGNSDSLHPKPYVNGFLYDTSRGLQLEESSVLTIPSENLLGLTITCQPFYGCFKLKSTDFVVVTFSVVSETCIAKILPSILEQLEEKVHGKKNVFLMGDFILPPGHTVFEVLSSQGYSSLLPVQTSLNGANSFEGSHIWSSSNIRKMFTGRSGIITEGLSHLAIPDGWKWGGVISRHCPVWAELFVEEDSNSSTSPPLLNGNCKPLLTTDVPETLGEKICTYVDTEKHRCKFWRLNFYRRNSKRLIRDNGEVKENGCL